MFFSKIVEPPKVITFKFPPVPTNNAAGELKDAPVIGVPSLGVTAKAVAACLTIVFCGIILFFKYINK